MPKADLYLAEAWLDSGVVDSGLFYIHQYLEIHPTFPQGVRTRAELYLLAQEYALAIKDYEHIIEIGIDLRPGNYLRLAATILLENPEAYVKALFYLDQGIEQLGPLVTLQKKAIEIESAHHQFESAIERIDVILSSSARKEHWLVQKAALVYKNGDSAQAIELYTQALLSLQELPPRLQNTAFSQELNRKIQKSLHDLQKHE